MVGVSGEGDDVIPSVDVIRILAEIETGKPPTPDDPNVSWRVWPKVRRDRAGAV